MFRFDRITAAIILGALAAPAIASASAETALASVTTAQAKKPPRTFSFWEIGVGYLQWNERLDLHRGNVSSAGVANFAGPALLLEKNWIRGRFLWGMNLGFASGRAVSGGYSGTLTFTDGVDRPWVGAILQPLTGYRVNRSFIVGAGAQLKYRKISWEPADQTLIVEAPQALSLAPSLNFRLRLAGRFTLNQSYIPLDERGGSQWLWGLHWIF